QFFVLDEADRMLDMGFIPDVRRIVGSLPHKDKRQTMFYSATLNDTVNRLATQWTKNPVSVEIEPDQVAVDTVEQHVLLLSASDKFNVLYNILQSEKPGRALIFCNRRDASQRLTDALQTRGVDCALLSGSVNQKARLRTLDDFRAGKINLVIATDVAGRGIHVDGIELVVNYDIPYEPEDYVHRIGRTGRAGTTGTAYTFACEEEAFTLPDIEEYIGKSLAYKQVDEALLAEAPKPSIKPKKREDAVQHGNNRSSNGSGGGKRPQRSGNSHKHRGSSGHRPKPHSAKK
ncbi:MAG: DEAD/DEAH box helicase, partial [Kiritimatiellae bacterium]|nr:DEAD/DEAH box helicase [Kiritimatiellia bacterium]